MDSTFDQVKDIIVKQLGVAPERVVSEAKFRDDLEADSLDLVELVMAFEDKFGGTIPDEDAQSLTTVQQAVDYVGTHLAK